MRAKSHLWGPSELWMPLQIWVSQLLSATCELTGWVRWILQPVEYWLTQQCRAAWLLLRSISSTCSKTSPATIRYHTDMHKWHRTTMAMAFQRCSISVCSVRRLATNGKLQLITFIKWPLPPDTWHSIWHIFQHSIRHSVWRFLRLSFWHLS